MHRLLKALLLPMLFVVIGGTAFSQALPIAPVSGRLAQTEYRVFTKDSLYQIIGDYHVSGLLIIEPGTTVEFLPNGRLIDSVGGRIIADGELQATWNGTSPTNVYPQQFCDLSFLQANVAIGGKPEISAPGPNWTNYAPWLLFYKANKLEQCSTDPNFKNIPYRRNVVRAPIVFRGRPVNKFSREWGHIVILPGADTAVFRNVKFVNFRKDTAATYNTDFYAPKPEAGYDNIQIVAGSIVNQEMRNMTTGGGGALTVFSSKTWIVDCRFDSNFARYHGGAVQFLQAPFDRYVSDPNAPTFYPRLPALGAHGPTTRPPADPETYDVYGSSISTPFGSIPTLLITDPSKSTSRIPPGPGPVQYRQTYDDGRDAVNKGRVRRLYFRDNRVVLSNFLEDVNGYRDVTTAAPVVGNNGQGSLAKNDAFGGAVYVSGRWHKTVYFGRALGDPTDTIVCERNHAVNYQAAPAATDTDTTNGARGGAFYVGDSTSMVFQLARFVDNFTAAPNIQATDYLHRARFSQGGGIYMSKTSPELTVRDVIHFYGNKSGQGGGIYVAGITNPFGNNIPVFDPFLSPNLLGDSVSFVRNIAEYDGGAIYTQRNMRIEGRRITWEDVNGQLIDQRILLDSNSAGLAGGAIAIDLQDNFLFTNARIQNALFTTNTAGDSLMVDDTRLILLYDPVANPATPTNPYSVQMIRDDYHLPRAITKHILGGGAIYSLRGNTNFFRATEFRDNWTQGGNGGAISMVTPVRTHRYFLSDGDQGYDIINNQPTSVSYGPEPWDQRQMTRFLNNRAIKDSINPLLDIHPRDPNYTQPTLHDPFRNGTGLGGAIYINDLQPPGAVPGYPRTDSVIFHRVRFEQNWAYSGAAIYSDNYELRMLMNKCLVANNRAVSEVGRSQDLVNNYQLDPVATDTAGAIFFAEVEGPLPISSYHSDANSIYDNDARFLVRLPDVPLGSVGQGLSGVDTLRGNYWGQTEAPVTTQLSTGTLQNTFYVMGDSCTLPLKVPATQPNEQGPFESPGVYTYTPVPIGMIPDTLLMEGRVYDIFDKGVDIKAVDYSNRRMAPIEDFSVGIPPTLNRYPNTSAYQSKVVRRLTRDPENKDPIYQQLQREFIGDHPIGYPLFLEARANYTGDANLVNDDPYALNHSVFFVINLETGDIIRSVLKQETDDATQFPFNTSFRSRVEFVPDSINRDPLNRRAREGRAAFSIGELYRFSPRYYMDQGFNPVEARFRAARYEDSVTLAGRRWGGVPGHPPGGTPGSGELGGAFFRYINRQNPVNFADVYGGESYHALPVLTGDRVWVVSRTMLWDTTADLTTVINNARYSGLEFQIDNDNSVMAPRIFGARDTLEGKTPFELRNTRFVWEDRNYPSDTSGTTRSPIFDLTAHDVNGFLDPRSLYFPDRYTGLLYEWSPMLEALNTPVTPNTSPAQVRLNSWLKVDTVYPANTGGVFTIDNDTAYGYLRFYGQPRNPDIVPGGELLEVRAINYPPSVRTIDSLKGVLPADTAAWYIFLYPPYYNCQVYDPLNARYLQQDTVDIAGASTATYRLRIFVQDSIPTIENNVAMCFDPLRGIPVANWTNKLRFDYDVQSDDELEDNAAVAEGWDFRYGRTTYGFAFTDDNQGNPGVITDDANEIRPTWMYDPYLHDPNRVPDNGATFLQSGNIVIRIDSLAAEGLLRNPAQANGVYNLDTAFAIVVNDGHTGQNKFDTRVIVNAAPVLQPAITGTLPNAKEDFDYNPQLFDTTRRVYATDRNYGQRVRYRLVYRNDAVPEQDPNFVTGKQFQDSNGTTVANTATIAYVPRDACYTEAGLWQAPKTTPDWIKINPVTGMLYGTPGLNDAPKSETITVVAEDEYGLTHVRTYPLFVDSTQHRPRLMGRPPIQCVEVGEPWSDSLCVKDIDLARVTVTETITITAALTLPGQPELPVQVSPSTFSGAGPDSVCFQLSLGSIPQQYAGTKPTVHVVVTDLANNQDSLRFEISVSEPLRWTMPLQVRNTNPVTGNAFQELVFGVAQNATTGDADDGAPLGRLDSNYCEYELPPLPPKDVFDSRWTISTKNGILRNIFPDPPPPGASWKGTFQPGNLDNGSPNRPVVICWSISDAAAAPANIHITDQTGGAVFKIDMTETNPGGHGVKLTQGIKYTVNGDTACVEISLTTVDGFKIVWGETSDVPVAGAPNVGSYALMPSIPNPFSRATEIGFIAPQSGKVSLEVYDVNGNLVKALLNEQVEAGRHSVTWNGTDEKGKPVASGTYTYRLTAGATVVTRTTILMR